MILEGMTGLLEGRTDGPTIFMEFWPHGLQGMGTDAGALLKTLQSYNYKFYDINPAGREGAAAGRAGGLAGRAPGR